MKLAKYILTICFTFCALHFLEAQEKSLIENEIKVIARHTKGKIQLRWAPTNPSIWQKLNIYGYEIQRFRLKKDGKLLDNPNKIVLASELKPEPSTQWETVVKKDDYAAVLAQALYGKKFSVQNMNSNGISQIINVAKEASQRYAFALYAADISFPLAIKAGLGFEDTTIVAGEEYVYRIKSMVPEKNLKIKEGSVVVSTLDLESLPKPKDLVVVSQDNGVLLTWDIARYKSLFSYYYVERSENETDFKQLNQLPLVQMNADKKEDIVHRMMYVDTIKKHKKYFYRIKGISPFGEVSPPSEVVPYEGISSLTAVPRILKHRFDTLGNIEIEWEFDKEFENQINGFELLSATQEKGPYKVIKSVIPSSHRKTIYINPKPSNYLRVKALAKVGQSTTSLTNFVQTIDSIPPVAPSELVGTIDTLGIVRLEWKANTESDLLGYRVFKANLDTEAINQLTVDPIKRTTFIDTVSIKSLNHKIYYQIVAEDNRYNTSPYSSKLELSIPDVIPPTAPIFSDYLVNNEGVHLTWIPSSSSDVYTHQIYRQEVKESNEAWDLIFETKVDTTFTDTKLKDATTYRYRVFAKDHQGLQSLPSTSVTLTSGTNTTQDLIRGFTAIPDRLNRKIILGWKKTPSEVVEILIYKSKNDKSPVLWKQLPGSINKIEDKKIHIGSKYTYILKVIVKSGAYPKTKKVNVTY